jgi:hypothetical protein
MTHCQAETQGFTECDSKEDLQVFVIFHKYTVGHHHPKTIFMLFHFALEI